MKQQIKIEASELKNFLGLNDLDSITALEYDLLEDKVVFNIYKTQLYTRADKTDQGRPTE